MKEMYFFISDISGYTAFMVKNQMERDHGTLIITELMKSLIKEIDLPMEIAKLEGDAIFFVLYKEKLESELKNDLALLTQKIVKFLKIFSEKVHEMQSKGVCDCGGCSNIDKLNLKIIAHYGQAAVDTIGSFKELSGVDVILVHRLLKNHAKSKHYILMTQSAYDHLAWPKKDKIEKGEEVDPDLGKTSVYIYYPEQVASPVLKKELSTFEKFIGHFKLALGGFLLKFKKRPDFHNFPPAS